MRIKIEDVNNLHKGYNLNLNPGYTALIGPNGAGKSTLLNQIKSYCNENNIKVISYSNLDDDGSKAKSKYLYSNRFDMAAYAMTASEGEGIMLNFGDMLSNLRKYILEAKEKGTQLFILLDSIDSGLSIDKATEVRDIFSLIVKDIDDSEDYLICAVNQYELVRKYDEAVDSINVRNGKHMKFSSYKRYSDFIIGFEEAFPRVEERD